jgi:hypothetical protein
MLSVILVTAHEGSERADYRDEREDRDASART